MPRTRINRLELLDVNRAVQTLSDEIDRVDEKLQQLRSGALAFTGDLDLAGFRLTNAGSSEADDDLVTQGELIDRLDEIEEEASVLETQAAEEFSGGGRQRRLRRRTSRLISKIEDTAIGFVEDAVHGVANQVGVFIDTNEISGFDNLQFDNANTSFIINNATNAPQAAFDVWVGSAARAAVFRGGSGALASGVALQFTTGGIGGDVNTAADNLGSMIMSVTATSPTSAEFRWFTNAAESIAERMVLTGAGHLILDTAGISGVPPAAGYDTVNLNVIEGFGTVPAHPTGTLAKFQNNDTASDDCYLALLAGTTGESGVLFGDSGDADRGRVIYDHNVDELQHYMAGAQGVTFTGGDNVIIRPAVSPNLSGPNGIIYGSDVASANLILASTTDATTGFIDTVDTFRPRHTNWPDPPAAGVEAAVLWNPSFASTNITDTNILYFTPQLTSVTAAGGLTALWFSPTVAVGNAAYNVAGVAMGGTLTYSVDAGSSSQVALFTSAIRLTATGNPGLPSQAFVYDDRTFWGLEGTASETSATGIVSFNANPTIFAEDMATLDCAGNPIAAEGVVGLRYRPLFSKDAGASLSMNRASAVYVSTSSLSIPAGVVIDQHAGLDMTNAAAFASTNFSVYSDNVDIDLVNAGAGKFGATGAITGKLHVVGVTTLVGATNVTGTVTASDNVVADSFLIDNTEAVTIPDDTAGLGAVTSGTDQILLLEAPGSQIHVIDNNDDTTAASFLWGTDGHHLLATALMSLTDEGHLSVSPNAAGGIQINPYGASAGNTGELRLLELAANGTAYTGFKSPDDMNDTNVIYTLPDADGTNGQQLTTNGSAVLTWEDAGSGGSGELLDSTFVRFTSTDTVASSTPFVDADDGTNVLEFAVGDTETWIFKVFLQLSGSASSDVQFQFTGPASVTLIHFAAHSNQNVQGDAHAVSALSTSTGRVSINSSATGVWIEGVVISNANTGDITLQWATNSGTDTQTMAAGSFLWAYRIA